MTSKAPWFKNAMRVYAEELIRSRGVFRLVQGHEEL